MEIADPAFQAHSLGAENLRIFVDCHARADISADAFQRGLEAAEQQRANAVGACPIDYLVAPGGRLFCIIEAPDPAAVQRLHDELGLPQSAVSLLDGADGASPLSDHDRDLILRLIHDDPEEPQGSRR